MKRVILLTAALVVGLLVAQPLPVGSEQRVDDMKLILLEESDQGISLELQIPWQSLHLEEQVVEGKTYLEAYLPGAVHNSQPGAPDLPLVLANLGVPFDTTFEVSVSPGRAHEKTLSDPILPVVTEKTTYNISVEAQKLEDAYTTQAFILEDAQIYKSDTAYPTTQSLISGDGVIRQQRIIGLQLSPLSYQPNQGKLTVYESLFVRITFLNRIEEKHEPVNMPESEVYESFFRDSLLNYESAKNWRRYKTGQEYALLQTNTAAWLPPEPAWRVQVRQDGMHQISYEQLEIAGVPVEAVDPTTLQMFYQGSEIAILVDSVSEHQFAAGDSLIFYGERIDDKYTQDNVYWLTYGQAQGLRMETQAGMPAANPNADEYLDMQRQELNQNYIPSFSAEDDYEHFFGKFIRPQVPAYSTITLPYNLTDVKDGAGLFRVAFVGALNVFHQVVITVNGVDLPDIITWNAFDLKIAEINLPAGSLVEGANTVVISTPNDNDLFYLDWAELVYSRGFTSTNDRLLFEYSETGEWDFAVEGFTSADLQLFDVSANALAKQIEGFSVENVGAEYKLQFSANISASTTFWAGSPAAYQSVNAIIQDQASDLQSAANGADYIIITHSAFSAQAEQLANFRASQGLRVKVVNVQDVYDQFGYGITGVQPIQSFLSFAYSNWSSPSPSYVVLLGDGHFDPKNYMGFGRQSFIPPYLANVDPLLGETSADNRYVAFVGDDSLPDMMLGRLAVNTTLEAQSFVNKIIAYEQTPAEGDWDKEILAVADDLGSGLPFAYISDDLISCCLPNSYDPVRVYLVDGSALDLIAAREAIIEEINAGKLLVNYIGHAAASQWSDSVVWDHDGDTGTPGIYIFGILNVNDLASLNNLNKYPVILSMTCWDGYYIYPNPTGGFYEALAEVYTKAANKGAVAAWSSSGLGVATGHDYLNKGFYITVFKQLTPGLGQATAYGKLFLWTSGANLDLLDTYLLFGDPATNLKMTINDLYLPLITN